MSFPAVRPRTGAKFAVVFLVATVICTISWDRLAPNLYDCSDDGPIFDYLQPGWWVHEVNGVPPVDVPVIVHNRSMSEPDEVLESVGLLGLWLLWLTLFGASVAVSALLARLPWRPRCAPNTHPPDVLRESDDR